MAKRTNQKDPQEGDMFGTPRFENKNKKSLNSGTSKAHKQRTRGSGQKGKHDENRLECVELQGIQGKQEDVDLS